MKHGARRLQNERGGFQMKMILNAFAGTLSTSCWKVDQNGAEIHWWKRIGVRRWKLYPQNGEIIMLLNTMEVLNWDIVCRLLFKEWSTTRRPPFSNTWNLLYSIDVRDRNWHLTLKTMVKLRDYVSNFWKLLFQTFESWWFLTTIDSIRSALIMAAAVEASIW